MKLSNKFIFLDELIRRPGERVLFDVNERLKYDCLSKRQVMSGKKAKILSDAQVERLLAYTGLTRYPDRNQVMVLLSVKAGLRAGEIAHLTWEMVLEPGGAVGSLIELHDRAAKKKSGRAIPIHADLRDTLISWQALTVPHGAIVRSERGEPMHPVSIVHWFKKAYRFLNLDGCSSHSGRRTFITRAARLVHKAGGSLRDVQLLAGHRSIQTTQGYIDGDSDVQRRLVALI
jgi:integrase